MRSPLEYQGHDYEIRSESSVGLRRTYVARVTRMAMPYLRLEPMSGATHCQYHVFGEAGVYCEENSPDGNACDEFWSLNEYGRLYNWYAVDDARGLCPIGWHVPTVEEWTMMISLFGTDAVSGYELKETYGWLGGGNGFNSSGFSGLPGGIRYENGNFYWAGMNGFWWSSSLQREW